MTENIEPEVEETEEPIDLADLLPPEGEDSEDQDPFSDEDGSDDEEVPE